MRDLIWYVMRDRVTHISNLYGDPYSLITHSSGPKPRGMGYEGVNCTMFCQMYHIPIVIQKTYFIGHGALMMTPQHQYLSHDLCACAMAPSQPLISLLTRAELLSLKTGSSRAQAFRWTGHVYVLYPSENPVEGNPMQVEKNDDIQ